METSSDTSSVIENLVERVRRGDHEAFERLTGRYRARLESVIRLRLPDKIRRRVDPDDVLQETLLRAFRAMPEFCWEGRPQFISWLTTIAERTCTETFRKHVLVEKAAIDREVSLPQAGTGHSSIQQLVHFFDPGRTGPSRLLRREERLERLERAVNELPENYREIIVLSVVQRVPTNEVAQRLGMTVPAVCMLRSRALRKLRDVFGHTDSCRLPNRPLDLDNDESSEPETL